MNQDPLCRGLQHADSKFPGADQSPSNPVRLKMMYAVVRSYAGQGVAELFEALAQRQDEIEYLFGRDVQGLVSYTAVQTSPDRGTTITVCQDQGGAEESSRVAAAWVAENLSTEGVNPPTVAGGTAVAYFTA